MRNKTIFAIVNNNMLPLDQVIKAFDVIIQKWLLMNFDHWQLDDLLNHQVDLKKSITERKLREAISEYKTRHQANTISDKERNRLIATIEARVNRDTFLCDYEELRRLEERACLLDVHHLLSTSQITVSPKF
jgi:hypothetical protein